MRVPARYRPRRTGSGEWTAEAGSFRTATGPRGPGAVATYAGYSAETLKGRILTSYMYDMLTVRLPEEIEERLTALAKATGRSKSYYAREAIQDKLEDLEDAYLGAAVLERIRKGEERVLSSADMWHGLDD